MNGFKNRLAAGAIAVSLLALALAPSALAAGSSVKGYGGAGGHVQSALASEAQGTAAATSSGALPFTGLDIVLALAGGLVLLALGIAVAYLVPRSERA